MVTQRGHTSMRCVVRPFFASRSRVFTAEHDAINWPVCPHNSSGSATARRASPIFMTELLDAKLMIELDEQYLSFAVICHRQPRQQGEHNVDSKIQ